jgi:hypothetical protein
VRGDACGQGVSGMHAVMHAGKVCQEGVVKVAQPSSKL